MESPLTRSEASKRFMCSIDMIQRVSSSFGMDPQDRKYHQFLWRSMNQAKQPDVFEFHSLVFGVNSAPTEAKFIFQEYAMELRDYYPLATDTELNSTYMEDTMGSVADENRGIKLYKELSALWGKAGMHERKWLSNSANVLEKIPAKDRANDVDLSKDHTHTEPSQWRYVTTKINRADKITRGMAVKDMQNLSYWWSGPEFLGKTEDECPSRQIIPKEAVKKQKGPDQKFTNVSQKDGKK